MSATKIEPKTSYLMDRYFDSKVLREQATDEKSRANYNDRVISARNSIASRLSETTPELVIYRGHVFTLEKDGGVRITRYLTPDQVDEKAGE